MNEGVRVQITALPQNWGALLLRGICAVLFGLLILDWPGVLLIFLVYLFGASALIGGVLALFTCLSPGAEKGHRWLLLLQGALGVAVGVYVFCRPEITAIALIILIAVWALISGIFETAAAARLPSGTAGRGLLSLSGVISIIFGLLVLGHPMAGIIAIVWLIGIYALIGGLMLIVLSLGLRSRQRQLRSSAA